MIEVSPMEKIRMPKLPKLAMPVFSDADVLRLLAACDTHRDRAMVFFLLDTGVRVSEMVALNVDNVDMESGAVLVEQGKGQKDRIVYVSARTLKQVARYLSERTQVLPASPLWLSLKRKNRLSTSGLMQFTRKLGKRAGVSPCTTHMYRRYWAVKSLKNGMDVFVLQRLGGWEDMSTMKRYMVLAGADLEDAARQFGVVDRLHKP